MYAIIIMPFFIDISVSNKSALRFYFFIWYFICHFICLATFFWSQWMVITVDIYKKLPFHSCEVHPFLSMITMVGKIALLIFFPPKVIFSSIFQLIFCIFAYESGLQMIYVYGWKMWYFLCLRQICWPIQINKNVYNITVYWQTFNFIYIEPLHNNSLTDMVLS